MLLGIAVLIFYYQFVFFPGRRQMRSLQESLTRKERDLKTLEKLSQEYKERVEKRQEEQVNYSPENFSLIGFLSEAISATGVRDNVREVKPLPSLTHQEATVERIRLVVEELTLEAACNLLKYIESQKLIYFPSFQMKRHRDKPYWVNLEVELCVLKKGSGQRVAAQ
ncbi:MAG: hypothetical protein NC911_01975 [Candidatus Omnitrophica bacterium]|nr:hypothetical protein [Candidatus Omnitrophota bacterium]